MKIDFSKWKLHISGVLFFLLASIKLFAQPAQDMPCQSSVFYGNVGSAVHRLQFNGSSITDLGVLTTPTQNMFGLAYGMDITQGSTHRTLYGSAANASFNQSEIIRYDGTGWTSIVTDSLIYHNAAAYGPFIYFMHSTVSGQPNNQCISRLNPNGTLTKIFTDTSLIFSVADMAVDSLGNVYFFRGTSIGATTQLVIINAAGTIVQTFTTNLNNMNTFFGAMFLNGALYLGWNTVNGQLIPVNMNGSVATLGTGIPLPAGISMRDLANCHDSAEVSTPVIPIGYALQDIVVFPNPAVDGDFTINVAEEFTALQITDLTGRLMIEQQVQKGLVHLHISQPGTYLVSLSGRYKAGVKKLVVL